MRVALRSPEGLTVIRVAALTCVALLGSTATLRAGQALQSAPEQDTLRSLITRALESVPVTTDAAVERDWSGRGIGNRNKGQEPSWLAERRACEGCPPRSVGRALLQTTLINVVYESANLIRGQVTARITPKTWWANMKHGWVWDLDDFEVNQVGHPYQGNNYFTAGRANGLSFYESAALAAFGSGTWEYFGETNLPSVNDFINTTLGGIALGEMFHRAAWLVRDTHATGRGRLWSEIGATALDPLTGLNRFRTGDAKRITEKPAEMVPSALSGVHIGRRALARFGNPRGRRSRSAVPGSGHVVRRSADRAQPDAVRRILGEASLRRRRRLQRSQSARAAAGATVGQREEDAVHRHAKLRLSDQRRLRHRCAVHRGGPRRHAGAVVADRSLGHGMGRL